MSHLQSARMHRGALAPETEAEAARAIKQRNIAEHANFTAGVGQPLAPAAAEVFVGAPDEFEDSDCSNRWFPQAGGSGGRSCGTSCEPTALRVRQRGFRQARRGDTDGWQRGARPRDSRGKRKAKHLQTADGSCVFYGTPKAV